MTDETTKVEAGPALAPAPGSAFLPLRKDMLAMGVPETTAIRWHDAIWVLKAHAENMAVIIETSRPSHEASLAAKYFREAMGVLTPNDRTERREAAAANRRNETGT
jgi:hypothetical protein